MLIYVIFLFFFQRALCALDSISQFQPISDGGTLVSKGGTFELGFFTPGNSKNRYVGIWFKKIPAQTVVWVANRCNPINDTSGSLSINGTGNLVLLYQNESVVWSISPSKQAKKPIVELLDSGNLVLRDEEDGNTDNTLWQSFDYPSDTLLPGMKMGWDLRTGVKRRLSAWKSWDDPCPEDFSYGFEFEPQLHTFPDVYIRKGTAKFYRTGPWNGLRHSGSPEFSSDGLLYRFYFVDNENEVYYSYDIKNKSVISRIVLNQTSSSRQRLTWVEEVQAWQPYYTAPRDDCDKYGICGANGNCVINQNPICQCLRGFNPKSPETWNLMEFSKGCVRNNPQSCQEKDKDGFIKISGLKVPDPAHSWVNKSMSLKECRARCLSNCNCTAYTNFNISGQGSGCAIWFGDLMDIRQFPDAGQDLFIRMPHSELEGKGHSKIRSAVIVVAAGGAVSGMLILGYFICKRGPKDKNETLRQNGDQEEDLELPLFSLSSIATATQNFSLHNKLGEGGFGPVYRGKLEDGKEIAVKRLSIGSGQGVKELKNEVKLIAELQHRNLVKLLGCCIHGEEKLLVYEYMPNKSLDFFIFDQKRGKLLDWSKRFQIICGIARGLLYLHHDSRLRIIHRDLKASNVLLDNEMNPKISDFGLARTFGGDQTEEQTSRVIGTYGYMAPEYAFHGLFSIKSDVFSFGILVLEIVSGKKSRGFHHENDGLTLIGHAWKLHEEGSSLEMLGGNLRESDYNLKQVLHCIHVALLCVQQNPVDRPNMSSVILMLGNYESDLSPPKKPGYFTEMDFVKGDISSTFKPGSCSANEMSMTLLEAR